MIKHVVGNITAVHLQCYMIVGQARQVEVTMSKEDLSDKNILIIHVYCVI